MIVNLNSKFLVITDEMMNKLNDLNNQLAKERKDVWKLYDSDYEEFSCKSFDIDLLDVNDVKNEIFDKVLDILGLELCNEKAVETH